MCKKNEKINEKRKKNIQPESLLSACVLWWLVYLSECFHWPQETHFSAAGTTQRPAQTEARTHTYSAGETNVA